MTDELRARFEGWAVLYELQADLIAWHAWQACAADMQDMQRDAERYRWLRSNNTGDGIIWEVIHDDAQPGRLAMRCEDVLDQAIDAAMKGEDRVHD